MNAKKCKKLRRLVQHVTDFQQKWNDVAYDAHFRDRVYSAFPPLSAPWPLPFLLKKNCGRYVYHQLKLREERRA